MKKKLLCLILVLCMALTCTFVLTACGSDDESGQADPTLYQLTLSYSSNVASLDAFTQADLKATYGYGEPSAVVKEGVRDEDEIAELKKAGATDADIAKAGARQSDGSYYFFDQDPIYLEAPAVPGWKLLGFFYKGSTSEYPEYKPFLTDIDGKQALPRWNMDNKNVELEARYVKNTYEIGFNMMEDGDTNPNTISRYCYLDDGIVTLEPATTMNPHKTFVGWEYQDYSKEKDNWFLLEDNKLPIDYNADYMRISAIFEMEKFSIDFAFKHYIDPDNIEDLSFDEACDSIALKGNLTTVDGQPVKCDSTEDRTEINEDSEIKMEYGSWLEIYVTPISQFEVWYIQINGERFDSMVLNNGDITEDSTITIILTDKHE